MYVCMYLWYDCFCFHGIHTRINHKNWKRKFKNWRVTRQTQVGQIIQLISICTSIFCGSSISAGFGWAYKLYTIFPACMHVPFCDKISSYSFTKYLTSCVIWVDVIFISDDQYQKTLKDLEVSERNLQVRDCTFCFSQNTVKKKILLKMMMATCVILYEINIFFAKAVLHLDFN